jgi:hypothetical protein
MDSLRHVIISLTLFGKDDVKINEMSVENPFMRMAIAIVIVPFIGAVFYIFGLIGHFLLLPIISIFN